MAVCPSVADRRRRRSRSNAFGENRHGSSTQSKDQLIKMVVDTWRLGFFANLFTFRRPTVPTAADALAAMMRTPFALLSNLTKMEARHSA
jgi:hypothetical protein